MGRKITIESTTTVGPSDSYPKPYTAYEIRITHPFPRAPTKVQKRYSDFSALHSTLHSQTGTYPPAPLPPKSWLGGALGKLGIGNTAQNPQQIEERRNGLEAYLQAIEESEDPRWREARAYLEFLGLNKENMAESLPGSQFGKDRVRDSADWLDKFSSVKGCLQEARLQLTRREQAVAPQAQHEASANAKKELIRAGSLISALEEGLDRLGPKGYDEWGGDTLGEGEIRRRRDLISTARKERDGLDSVLNTMAVKAAVASSSESPSAAPGLAEKKEGLFKGSSSRGRVLGAPAKETEKTRELDNEGVLQLQKQIIAEQDEDLVDLAKVARRMREMGVQINEELVLQNQMLDMFDEDVTRVDGKMKIAKKRINKIS
ncbi:Phox-like protein [Delitschia confertaspora ATCC 74209]|uniref:Phox-like protein n=1 Tax=Delitschia confertaspora ATCC 74209 TaxID=1513339 RepID=A0A9P4JBP5_9PLEO|nr:Phox-like protein [Delitschia confertaspora ATCC 74209]